VKRCLKEGLQVYQAEEVQSIQEEIYQKTPILSVTLKKEIL
jgi:hypothetical protein